MDYIEEYVEKVKKVHTYYILAETAVSLCYAGILVLNMYGIINNTVSIAAAAMVTVPAVVFACYYENLFRCPVCKGKLKEIGVKKDMFGILPKHCPHCGTPIDKDKPDYEV